MLALSLAPSRPLWALVALSHAKQVQHSPLPGKPSPGKSGRGGSPPTICVAPASPATPSDGGGKEDTGTGPLLHHTADLEHGADPNGPTYRRQPLPQAPPGQEVVSPYDDTASRPGTHASYDPAPSPHHYSSGTHSAHRQPHYSHPHPHHGDHREGGDRPVSRPKSHVGVAPVGRHSVPYQSVVVGPGLVHPSSPTYY